MTLGVRDLKSISLPPGWDMAELARLSIAGGVTYDSIVQDMNAMLQAASANLNTGYLGNLVYVTTEPEVEYRSGSTGGFERHTENTQPDRQFSGSAGHMLPVWMRDRALGWTLDALREITQSTIDNDVNAMIEDGINDYEKAVWTRFFKYEKETGKTNGLGATGVSAPWADANNVNFTPGYAPPPRPDRMINAFSTSHTHYLRLDGLTQANLETAVAHLWEHGYDAPYDVIVSQADVGTWQDLTAFPKFVPAINALIQYGNASNLAVVDTDIYVGANNTTKGVARIKANARIPTGYWGVTKIFGNNDPRAPLRVRVKPDFGLVFRLVTRQVTLNPFEAAIGQLEFGVGVGESRVAAVVVEDDSTGSYTTPTIS